MQRATPKSSSEDREAKREALRKKLEEREAKENARSLKVFGLPIYRGEITMNLESTYGLAYITNYRDDWIYREGKFPFLYGLNLGLHLMTEYANEDNEENYLNSAFLLLDVDNIPIAVIDDINIPANLRSWVSDGGGSVPYGMTFRDLAHIESEDVPTFNPKDV